MPQDEIQQASVQETTSRENLRPVRTLNLLSYREIQSLMSANEEVRSLFRLCALAVLNSGNEIDDVSSLMESYPDFEIDVKPQSRGPIMDVRNAPISAFVDGNMIRGIQEHLFSVLRDVVYVNNALNGLYDLDSRRGVTEAVFDIQPPKTELITYLFGKIVFVTTNRMPTPTNNQVRFQIWPHNIRIA